MLDRNDLSLTISTYITHKFNIDKTPLSCYELWDFPAVSATVIKWMKKCSAR